MLLDPRFSVKLPATVEAKQRLLSSTFIKCDRIGNSTLCLGDNVCAVGYTGFKCKECDQGYFKNFKGECVECSGQAEHVLQILFSWLFLAILIYVMSLLQNY